MIQSAYDKELKRIESLRKINDYCPFCDSLRMKAQLFEEHDSFWVVFNKYAYKNTNIHMLIIPKRHIEDATELTQEEEEELMDVSDGLRVAMVSPEVIINGSPNSTVKHLHIHLIEYER